MMVKVGAAVVRGYECLGGRCRVQKHEWGIVAGIVATWIGQGSILPDAEGTVLAMATGNKCIGPRKMCPHGTVINDCHAEVLAKRGFRRLLSDQVEQALRAPGQLPPPGSLLEKLETDGPRYRLNPQIRLHLFVSELPCGDCSIVELVEGEFKYTGSKLASDPKQYEDDQAVGVLRTKSGRSNLREDDRSLSMSCSDKIARWNVLGLEGGFLSRFLDGPLLLDSVVLSMDVLKPSERDRNLQVGHNHVIGSKMSDGTTKINIEPYTSFSERRVEAVLEACWRGVYGRIESLVEKEKRPFAVHICNSVFSGSMCRPIPREENPVSEDSRQAKKRKRDRDNPNGLSPAGMAAQWIWTPHEGHERDIKVNNKIQQIVENIKTLNGQVLHGIADVIVQNRGTPQNKSRKPITCKSNQLQRVLNLSKLAHQNHEPNPPATYSEMKQNYTTPALKQRKQMFHQHFQQQWINAKPSDHKSRWESFQIPNDQSLGKTALHEQNQISK